jgi:hypothetical protein
MFNDKRLLFSEAYEWQSNLNAPWFPESKAYCKVCLKSLKAGDKVCSNRSSYLQGLSHYRCAVKAVKELDEEIECYIAEKELEAYTARRYPIERNPRWIIELLWDGCEKRYKTMGLCKYAYDLSRVIEIPDDDRLIFYQQSVEPLIDYDPNTYTLTSFLNSKKAINHRASFIAKKKILGNVLICTREEWNQLLEHGKLCYISPTKKKKIRN